jgi:hypothetical protein
MGKVTLINILKEKYFRSGFMNRNIFMCILLFFGLSTLQSQVYKFSPGYPFNNGFIVRGVRINGGDKTFGYFYIDENREIRFIGPSEFADRLPKESRLHDLGISNGFIYVSEFYKKDDISNYIIHKFNLYGEIVQSFPYEPYGYSTKLVVDDRIVEEQMLDYPDRLWGYIVVTDIELGERVVVSKSTLGNPVAFSGKSLVQYIDQSYTDEAIFWDEDPQLTIFPDVQDQDIKNVISTKYFVNERSVQFINSEVFYFIYNYEYLEDNNNFLIFADISGEILFEYDLGNSKQIINIAINLNANTGIYFYNIPGSEKNYEIFDATDIFLKIE